MSQTKHFCGPERYSDYHFSTPGSWTVRVVFLQNKYVDVTPSVMAMGKWPLPNNASSYLSPVFLGSVCSGVAPLS